MKPSAKTKEECRAMFLARVFANNKMTPKLLKDANKTFDKKYENTKTNK